MLLNLNLNFCSDVKKKKINIHLGYYSDFYSSTKTGKKGMPRFNALNFTQS